jgi:hypothetical protein
MARKELFALWRDIRHYPLGLILEWLRVPVLIKPGIYEGLDGRVIRVTSSRWQSAIHFDGAEFSFHRASGHLSGTGGGCLSCLTRCCGDYKGADTPKLSLVPAGDGERRPS